MATARFKALRNLHPALFEARQLSYLLGSSRSYSNVIANDGKCWRNSSYLFKGHDSNLRNNTFSQVICRDVSSYLYKVPNGLPWTKGDQNVLRSTLQGYELSNLSDVRFATTQAGAGHARPMGAIQFSMLSPGIIYEPYAPREKMPFWERYFTRTGWRRTKEDVITELKSAYAISKLRKHGYTKQKFYKEAVELYKEINSQIANGDNKSLRKSVTEKMFSGLKNEIKQRELKNWNKVHWELVEPIVKIRTLRARMIGIDKNDLNKAFIQLTLEFLAKQKFEAYDSNGAVVSGDKNKEVLVRDIWVFEKSLFHQGAQWRLCGRISPTM